ncbi:MAG: RagB/SusD family nutrient uptake outer membrane protein, partial [Halanaerobiaceae bacterium]
MKKMIISYIIGIFLIGGIFLSSCEEESFLERFPKDSPSEDVFFVDESSAKKAVVASYYPWTRSANMYQRDIVIMFDAMSDDSHWRPSRSGSIQQSNWNITPTHGAINSYWTLPYQSINAANYAIENIPRLLDKGLTQETLDPYIAEERFMRAFDY